MVSMSTGALPAASMQDNPGLTEKYEMKEQQVSPEYRRITRDIEESEDMGADEMMALLFRQASERYKTQEVRDEDIKSLKDLEVFFCPFLEERNF